MKEASAFESSAGRLARKNDYIIKNVYRSFLFVSILTAIVATVGMMIDNIVVGRFLGTESFSAMGIVKPISLIFSAFGNISASGGVTMAARALGRGDKNKVCSIFTTTVLYCVAVGAALMAGCWIFAPQISGLLGARGDTLQPTVEYLRGFALGAVPVILMPAVMGFVKLDGSPKLPLISMAVMTVLDVALDLLMAVVLKKGMFFMALATTISYFAAVGVGFLHFTRGYNTLRLIKPSELMGELREMFATGAATAVNRLCDTLKIIIFNNMLAVIAGTGAIAALNARSQVGDLVGSVIMGAGQALMSITALFYGEEDESALLGSLKESLKTGMLLCVVAMVPLLLVPSFFSSFFGVREEAVLVMADVGIRYFAVSMPIRLVNTLCISAYQSTEHSVHAMIASILQALVFTVLSALVLVQPMGVDGIMASFLAGEVLTFLYIAIVVGIRKKRLLPRFSDYMLLRKDFGKDHIRRWDLSVGNDMNEVMKLSEKITDRGQEEHIQSDYINILALAIEELAGNVVRHAFRQGEKKWFDVSIIEKQDELIVRMRDNAEMFDPLKYLHENCASGNIGIKLVTELASEVQYRRSIGLNNLIIRISKQTIAK